MEVICIEDKAFHALVKKVVENLRAETSAPKENKWITAADAMKLLDVTSKITLLRLRNAGKIKFTQPQKKIILYDRQSIIDYLNEHSYQFDYLFRPATKVIGFDGRTDGAIYSEVIKYSTLLKRAQQRNRIFLSKLTHGTSSLNI